MTAEQIADALGVSRASVYAWAKRKKRPCPADGPPWRYDLGEVRAWLGKRGRSPGKAGRPSRSEQLREEMIAAAESDPDTAADLPAAPSVNLSGVDLPPEVAALLEDMDGARLAKMKWDAEQSRLKALRMKGELMPRDDVERGRVERVKAVASVLETLPAKWAPRFVGCADAESLLREIVRQVREEFSRT